MQQLTKLNKYRKGYSGNRPDLNKLIDFTPDSILDVGCGAGLYLQSLAHCFPEAYLVGLDLVPPPIENLERELRHRISYRIGSAEDIELITELANERHYDIILFCDVLEHLVDPWKTLALYRELLTPQGILITSIPNVRHYSTLVRLLTSDRWPRKNRGIHDRTHLHFFARKDILDLGQSAGLILTREARNVRLIEQTILSQPLARLLDFWPFRPFITFQYLHVWRKSV